MLYRCVKDNISDVVIAIGRDENQSGQNYFNAGTWEDFTFEVIPQPDSTLAAWAEENEYRGSLLKVVNNAVVLRTVAELEAEISE